MRPGEGAHLVFVALPRFHAPLLAYLFVQIKTLIETGDNSQTTRTVQVTTVGTNDDGALQEAQRTKWALMPHRGRNHEIVPSTFFKRADFERMTSIKQNYQF